MPSISWQFPTRTPPLPTPAAVGGNPIKVLCPIQDCRKSKELRGCPGESNKNWLNRPSEKRLRELEVFQLECPEEGKKTFSRNKRIILPNCFFGDFFFFKVVTVGYSTEDSREGALMTFLFDINSQPLLTLSTHGIARATHSLKIPYCSGTSSQEHYESQVLWGYQGKVVRKQLKG